MRAMDMIQMGTNAAAGLWAQGRQVNGAVYVHVKDGPVLAFDPKDDDLAREEANKAAICAVIGSLKRRGLFQGAIFLGEAWSSKAMAHGRYERAADDPERVELFVAVAYVVGECAAVMHEIERPAAGPARLGRAVVEPGVKLTCWLDAAFPELQESSASAAGRL